MNTLDTPALNSPRIPGLQAIDDAPEAQEPQRPGESPRKYRHRTNIVHKATEAMEERPRTLIRWLHGHASDRDIAPGRLLHKETGGYYSEDSIFRLMTGRREESIEPMLAAIERLKALERERENTRQVGFVETRLTRRINMVCDAARIYQKIMPIYGPSHIGKTRALEEYTRNNNHGSTLYVRMPAEGGLRDFLLELAPVCRVSVHLPTYALRRQIKAVIDHTMLLIIDQAHEPLQNERSNKLPKSLLFAMEIFDTRKCGMVLAGTDVLEKAIHDGPFRLILGQLRNRSLGEGLRLPARLGAKDLAQFAAFYGLEPAEGKALALQTRVLQEASLGMWCTILQAASRIAAKTGHAMTWATVQKAKASLDALSVPMLEEDEEAAA